MKNLIISLVAVLVLFVIGCQENVITDPIVNEQADKVQAGIPEDNFRGVIPLNKVLNDPYPIGNSFYRISGQIEYNFRKIFIDPKQPAAQRHISLHLETSSDLQYFCTVCPPTAEDELSGYISEISDSFVPVGGNTVSMLEKSFIIKGRVDKMVLKVRFSISNDRVQVTAMWLALPKLNTEATELNTH